MQGTDVSYHQQKEENYCKWQDISWNQIQKEASFFQKKAANCMLMFGDIFNHNEDSLHDDLCLQSDVILGEQFYLEMVRPFCVDLQYLPQKQPNPTEVQDIHFPEEEERLKLIQQSPAQKKEEKGAKKNFKVSGVKKEEKMKMQIFKGNLQRDIQAIAKSHSMENLQVEFGLRQKKVELKLITFFYVAYYIRKNKAKQKVDEGQIFELINILIKIVRMYSHLQGPSFLDNSRKIETSRSLILDLKYCIKVLKEYHSYSNQAIMSKFPKLIYYNKYNRFFPILDIRPLYIQTELIEAVKSAFNQDRNLSRPTLIFFRTMIGNDKTIMSLALSQLVQQCKQLDGLKNSKLQVLYSCLNSSMRIQVGRYCQSMGKKYALAAMEKSIRDQNYQYPRIINCWKWRKEKVVDLIISDPHCTYEMLDRHQLSPEEEDIMRAESVNRKQGVNVGKLDRENIILFVDEPTAFCKKAESRTTRKLFDILANYPPKIIILASATMPQANELSKTIELVRRKNPGLQVIQVKSRQIQIGCQIYSFKGEIIFPHTGAKNHTDLKRIKDILNRNNFLLKFYTGPSLSLLLNKCEELGIKNLPRIDQLPEIKQEDITKWTFDILDILVNQKDHIISSVCTLSKDETFTNFKQDIKNGSDDQIIDFMEQGVEEKKQKEEEEHPSEKFINFKRILKGDAYKFLGGCLIGTSKPIQFAYKMFEGWVRKIKPIKRLTERLDKKKAQRSSKLKPENELKVNFPEYMQINTYEHYQRYCNSKEASHHPLLTKPIPIQHSKIIGLIEEVDETIVKLLLCGVAVYCEKGLSAKYLQKVEQLASSKSLAFIVTDRSLCQGSYGSDDSLCYGTSFPISNIILTDDLVEKLSINEMFQLIGRAGRLGHGWTARAFLQPHGLQKLNDYIHKTQSQISDQGRIFEEIADENLNQPLLRLRNLDFEVRYLDGVDYSERIQIDIRKKDAQFLKMKGITLLPFITTKNGSHYLCKNSQKTLQNYEFPSRQFLYTDIPTLSNDGPINVTAFYTNSKDFICQIFNNALLRILSQGLQGKLSHYSILNHLMAKFQEPYFCLATGMLSIFLCCNQQESFKVENQELEQLSDNPFREIERILQEKIQNGVEGDIHNISVVFLDSLLSTKDDQIKTSVRKDTISEQDQGIIGQEQDGQDIGPSIGEMWQSIEESTGIQSLNSLHKMPEDKFQP